MPTPGLPRRELGICAPGWGSMEFYTTCDPQPILRPPVDFGRGSVVWIQPEEEPDLWFWRGGHCSAFVHTGAGFRSNLYRETGGDHAHQDDNPDPDMDDVAAQQHPTKWSQLRSSSTEVSAGVCHPDTGEYSRGSVDCWRHLLFCRNDAYEAPCGPEKVQQGLGFPHSDHESLPVLWSACRP